jgi:hypothetical protein
VLISSWTSLDVLGYEEPPDCSSPLRCSRRSSQPTLQLAASLYSTFKINVTLFSYEHWCYWYRQLREWFVEARSDNKNSTIFWDVRPCSPKEIHWRFGETYRLHLQGWRVSPARRQFSLGSFASLYMIQFFYAPLAVLASCFFLVSCLACFSTWRWGRCLSRNIGELGQHSENFESISCSSLTFYMFYRSQLLDLISY